MENFYEEVIFRNLIILNLFKQGLSGNYLNIFFIFFISSPFYSYGIISQNISPTAKHRMWPNTGGNKLTACTKFLKRRFSGSVP